MHFPRQDKQWFLGHFYCATKPMGLEYRQWGVSKHVPDVGQWVR
jgi:hypothetical protein